MKHDGLLSGLFYDLRGFSGETGFAGLFDFM